MRDPTFMVALEERLRRAGHERDFSSAEVARVLAACADLAWPLGPGLLAAARAVVDAEIDEMSLEEAS